MRCPRCGWRFGLTKDQSSEIRKEYPRAFKIWTQDEVVRLGQLVKAEAGPVEMMTALGRPVSAIQRQIEKMGLQAPKEEPEPQPEPHSYVLDESNPEPSQK